MLGLKNRKKIYIIGSLTIVVLELIFLLIMNNNMAKNLKIGNNTNSQEIVNNILNISSYESTIDVEIKSNKNNNKYVIKQKYLNEDENSQEVIEPNNIAGIKISKNKNNLKIENSKLGVEKILENYEEITNNYLDLYAFINDYKNNQNSKYKEENEMIEMNTTTETKNIYTKYETLYVSKNTEKPIKMEIKDTNQNLIVYIIYKEINIK